MLIRALKSVTEQTHPVSQISVALDTERLGAGPTRNRALSAITAEWTCFLDDDDYVYPNHVEALLAHQAETGADVVFPWFDVQDGTDPFPMFEGKPWSNDDPHIFPITVLVRTDLAQSAAFPAPGEEATWSGDDWPYWLSIIDKGGVISHLNQRTWRWVHHSANSSGLARNIAWDG